MFSIKCESKDKAKLHDLVPFQGDLKKRTPQDIQELKQSIMTEGLLMPFAVWMHEDKNYLLDGHGRLQALTELAVEHPDMNILMIDFPCIFISAETEMDARKALLQITSSYGKITKQGVKQFTVSIPGYVAPSIKKFVAKPEKAKVTAPKSDKTVIRIRVDNDKAPQVFDILRQMSFIEVL